MQHNVKRVQLSQEARKLKLEKDKIKTRHYRKLTKKLFDGRAAKDFSLSALKDTTELLHLNPEFNTIWNYRRHILLHLFQQGQLDKKKALEDDLKMVMAQLKGFPKCYWIWNHRYWCLQQLDNDGIANWAFELQIVSKLLEMDSRNFHGWHYRRYVVENMEKNATAKEEKQHKTIKELEIDLAEFQYTTAKINKNISNFSAWHNRTILIAKIFRLLGQLSEEDQKSISGDVSLFQSPTVLFHHDIDLLKTGIYMDADDSSVWLYMQWLMTEELFVEPLKRASQYQQVLQKQIADIDELNELERSDSPTNSGNVWCLKSLVMFKSLLHGYSEEVRVHLQELVHIDPLRRGHYEDVLDSMGHSA